MKPPKRAVRVRMLTPSSDQVLTTLDPRLQSVNDFDFDAVLGFLHALTARDASDLSEVVPAFVPSGLPLS